MKEAIDQLIAQHLDQIERLQEMTKHHTESIAALMRLRNQPPLPGLDESSSVARPSRARTRRPNTASEPRA